jgi:hypothetical protein
MIETCNRVVFWVTLTIAIGDYVFRVVTGHNRHYEISTENYSQTSNCRKLWTYFTGGTNTSMDNEYSYSCFNRYNRVRAR